MILRSSSSHEEGDESGKLQREWSVGTKHFSGSNGKLEKLHGVRLEWEKDDAGRMQMKEVAGSEFVLDVDLVLLAMGFLGPETDGMISQLGVKLDNRGNCLLYTSPSPRDS